MLSKETLQNGIFLKIETSLIHSYYDLPQGLSTEWEYRYNRFSTWSDFDGSDSEMLYNRKAASFPEFGKVSKIVLGVYNDDNTITIETLEDSSEQKNLNDLAVFLDSVPNMVLGGYNIVNHDAPFLIKRFLINKIKMPHLLNINGKKPWEVNIIDIMREYQGTTYEFIDLGVVNEVFGYGGNLKNTADQLKRAMEIARDFLV